MKRRQFLQSLAAGTAASAAVAGAAYARSVLRVVPNHGTAFSLKQMKAAMTDNKKPAVIICVDGQEKLLAAVNQLNNSHMNTLKVSHIICYAYRSQLSELKLPADKNIAWYANDLKTVHFDYIDYQKCQGEGGLPAKLSDILNGDKNKVLNERIAAQEKVLAATADGKKLLEAYKNLEADSFKDRRNAKNLLRQHAAAASLLLLKGRFQKEKIESRQACIDIINAIGPGQAVLGSNFASNHRIIPFHGKGDGCPACGLGYIPSHSIDFINAFKGL